MVTPEDLPLGFSERELLIEENNSLNERVDSLLEKLHKLEYENEVLKNKLRQKLFVEDDWK